MNSAPRGGENDDADSGCQTSRRSKKLSLLASLSGRKRRRTDSTAQVSSSDFGPETGGPSLRLRTSLPRNKSLYQRFSSPDPVRHSELPTPRSSGQSKKRDLAKWSSSLELLGYDTEVELPHTPRLSPSPSRKRILATKASTLELTGFAFDVEPPMPSGKKVTKAKVSYAASPIVKPVVSIGWKKALPTTVVKLTRPTLQLSPHEEPSIRNEQPEMTSSRRSTSRRSIRGDTSLADSFTAEKPHQRLVSNTSQHLEPVDSTLHTDTQKISRKTSLMVKPVVSIRWKKALPTTVVKLIRPTQQLSPHEEASIRNGQPETSLSRRSTSRRSTMFGEENDSSADSFTGKKPHQFLASNENEHLEPVDNALHRDTQKPYSSPDKTTRQPRYSPTSLSQSAKPVVPARLKKAPPTKVIQFSQPSLTMDSCKEVNAVKGSIDATTGRMLAQSNEAATVGSRSRSMLPFKPRSHLSTAESQFVFGLQVDTSAESSIGSEQEEPRKMLTPSPTSGPPRFRSSMTSPATSGRKLGRSHESLGLVMSGHRPKPGDADYQKQLRINDDDDTSRRELMTPGQLRHCMDRINTEAVKAAKQHVEYIRMNGGDPSWSLVSAERIARKIKIQVSRLARTTPLPTSRYKTPMFRDRAHAAEMKRLWQAKIDKSKSNLEKLEAQHDVLQREVEAQTRRNRELEQRYQDELARAVQPHPMHCALLNRFKPKSNPGYAVPMQPSSTSKRKSRLASKTKDKLPAELFQDAPEGTLHRFLEAWTRDGEH